MTAGRFPGKIGRRVADRIAGWPSRPGTAAKTPDVLVLLFDDVGFADLGCYGASIRAPVIDPPAPL